MSSIKPKKFWRVVSPTGRSYLYTAEPDLAEGDTLSKVGRDGVTWREYAELMDQAAADSSYSALEGMHEWLARRIMRAAGEEDRTTGEVIAQRVLRSIYEEYGGLHGVY
jgi:hypothetical protein